MTPKMDANKRCEWDMTTVLLLVWVVIVVLFVVATIGPLGHTT